MTIRFTIITPTYNSAKDIEKCLRSVADQGFESKEHLIIDSASTDGTRGIVQTYIEQYPHILMISEKDAGIYDAMNRGVALARGEWVIFLGSDDELYDSSVLEDISDFLAEDTELLYGDVWLKGVLKRYGGRFPLLRLQIMNICQQSIFYRRSIFDTVGEFDARFKISADWDFNLRCFQNPRIKRHYVNRLIARYALTGYSAGKIDITFLLHRLFRNARRYLTPVSETPIREESHQA
ncbi:MAG: glycosyltransferase [Candidatus Moranbacteria bacterium]|nr:glycosyltransferase [Candidatus Moranbacteria bacterium]